jgi:energy-coupling factor transport system substrate-specific component
MNLDTARPIGSADDSRQHADAAARRWRFFCVGARTRQRRWEVRELAAIGIFAAIAKVSSLMVALAGGGMNPLTLVLKNLVFTALLVVLMFKVRKSGTLTLFVLVSSLFTAMLLGAGIVLLPPMLAAGLCAEGLIIALGGYRRSVNLFLGVALFDLLFKLGSVGLTWLFVREQPQLIWLMTIMVAVGYSGALMGLFAGARLVKELHHAGIIFGR